MIAASVPVFVFNGSSDRTSHPASANSALNPTPANLKEHFVSGGLLGAPADNVASISPSTSVSPSCSPSPSFRDLDEGYEDMDISDDDLATPTPESALGTVHETSHDTRNEPTRDVRSLAEMESGSRSFIKYATDVPVC